MQLKRFLMEEDGVGVIEVVLILNNSNAIFFHKKMALELLRWF